MPIKRRDMNRPADAEPATYAAFRAYWWEKLDRTNFNFRGSVFIRPDGVRTDLGSLEFMFQPRLDYPLKDIWHCGSLEVSKAIVQKIVDYPDVTGLELRGKWVWVDCTVACGKLEGQPVDERTNYRGR